MAPHPEQSAGIIPLLALAFFVGSLAWDRVRAYEWPAYSPPMCESKGRYLGRNDAGIARFEYFRRCNRE